MAFDAGMLSFVVKEINNDVAGGRIEKIYQPGREEFVFIVRGKNGTHRLLINAGSRCPRILITGEKTENPLKAPMLCMLFRKYLSGALFVAAEQVGFDRAAKLEFDTSDELGFKRRMYLFVEMMGKYSNIILTDEERKIIAILRQIGFGDNSKRQMLPGMIYEDAPGQNKLDPYSVSPSDFDRLCLENTERLCEKFIMSTFSGISPLVARELAAVCGGNSSATLTQCAVSLKNTFFSMLENIRNGVGTPTLVCDKNGAPKEYCFMDITQYGDDFITKHYETFGELLDVFFAEKSREEKLKARASDVLNLVASSKGRTVKKLSLQQKELSDCEAGDKYRLWGDLVTANIYRLKKGMSGVVLNDYNTGEDIEVPLDSTLTPAANAQRYYKKYSKARSAREHLTQRIEMTKSELEYIESVEQSLNHAATEAELSEIREELYSAGYTNGISRKNEKKVKTPSYLTFRTTNGYTVLCGKNNTANDYLTFKLAEKGDWWFHAKKAPGSHVILRCAGLPEPPGEDFTDAALIAAVYSSLSSKPVADIDYTYVKTVKKPPNAKPGFVIYNTNWSATVKVDAERVERMKIT